MDADNGPARRPSPAQGGTIEPANRAAGLRERLQSQAGAPGERYELRDPFAEVTYRADTFAGMVAKADELGSDRFIALDAEGRRTTVQKVDGEWQRGPQRAAAPERPMDTTPVRDNVPESPEVTSTKAPPRVEAEDKAIAKTDARAERAALVARLETALTDRYVIKRAPVTVGDVTIGRTEYRFRGDTSRIAFTESTFRLATDTNSPSVARSMVDVAEARNWRALRVSGSEDFRRMVWLEASVRGVRTLGYEPNSADLEVLRREHEARQVNRIEPVREAAGDKPLSAGPSEKGSARGGGRKTVLAAIEAVLIAQQVPEKKREAVMAAATEKLAQRMKDGQAPKVRLYDKAAPSRRPAVTPAPEIQRGRERPAPAPVR